MSTSTTDQDRGYKALFQRLASSKAVLTVGVHGAEGGAAHEGGGSSTLTVADIATVHEYGLGNNPERSFIRAWADENATKNQETMRKIGKGIVSGKMSLRQGLDRAGLRFVAEVRQRLKAGISPPLDPVTVARKGSSVPLINTGQLWTSIRHVVKMGE